jgi:hypothetical protein
MATKRDGSRDWEEYAKDRYVARRNALVEFRGWARQFMQFVGVVIAIEMALFGKLVDLFSIWSVLPMMSLLGTVAYQLTRPTDGMGWLANIGHSRRCFLLNLA